MHKARSMAMYAKETKYNTGLPCRRGHLVDRYVSNGACVECTAIASAKQAAEIAEAIRTGSPSAPRLILKAKQEEACKKGGPTSAAEARELQLTWFQRGTTCGCGIVGLDGLRCAQSACPDRGYATRFSKEALDLLD